MRLLVLLATLAAAEDAAANYFGLIDVDASGHVDENELETFVASMLTMSGMENVDLDTSGVGGKPLRTLVREVFASSDKDNDGGVSFDEAIAAQEAITMMMGVYMSHNLPDAEF